MECACKYYVVNKGGLKRVFLLKIEKYAHYFCKKIKNLFFSWNQFSPKATAKKCPLVR